MLRRKNETFFLINFTFLVFLLSGSTAFASPKNITNLFPALPNLDKTKIYDRNSPEYHQLLICKGATDKAANCNAAGVPRFYDLSSSAEVNDTFDLINRCIGFKSMLRYPRSAAVGNSGQIVITANTIDCPNLDPNEVAAAQLVICYESTSGVQCNFATACFEGSLAQGLCTKDYWGGTIIVPIAP